MYKYFNIKQDPKMAGLNEDLMKRLDLAREYAGIPFVITSGVRTEEKNTKAEGTPKSSHLTGLACDIACNNSKQQFAIVKGAIYAGFQRIGIGDRHIHLDIDPNKTQDVLFYE